MTDDPSDLPTSNRDRPDESPGASGRFERADEIYFAVCKLEGGVKGGFESSELQGYVDTQCAGDSELKSLVMMLLRGELSPLASESGRLEANGGEDDRPTTTALPYRQTAVPLPPPERIGNYRILERLGEGGFGVVYMAEQERPVRRRVALKILKLGMDTEQVVARFEAERQALALMDHPNIARVFDAGTTENGRPYFVMELVAGESITRYCDHERLSISERLELFCTVCEAVQHAHTKGVIHRDIKPSNVMVSKIDGKPVAKVIDFGIAKAIEQRLSEKTVFTENRQFIGTPEYMSPEQAEGSLDIDTRTDVYALGVLLYELLTGSTPFDGRSLRSAAFAEMQRIIREVDPPRPSTRLTELSADETKTIAENRRSRGDSLAAELRRELEWIPLRAMRKDRTDRYDSPADLARDIENYLKGYPLEAGPESAAYRLRKLVRRRRGLVAASGAVLASLLLGLVGFAWQAHRVGVQRDAAVTAGEREAEARRSNESTLKFIVSSLQTYNPYEGGDQDIRVGDAMLGMVTRLNAGEFTDQPEVKSMLLSTIASILQSNGRPAEALPLAEESLRLIRAEHSVSTKSEVHAAHLLTAERIFAECLGRLGRYGDALAIHEAHLASDRALHSGDHPDTVVDMTNRATMLRQMGREPEALRDAHEAHDMALRLSPPNQILELSALGELTACQNRLGKKTEAFENALKYLNLQRERHQGDHPPVAYAIGNVASIQISMGKYAPALEGYEEALGMFRRIFKGDHPAVAASISRKAKCLVAMGRAKDALPMIEDALAMRRRLYIGDHPDIATGLNDYGHCLWTMERPSEALPVFEEVLAMNRRLQSGDHPETANALGNIGSALMELNRAAEALPRFTESLEMFRRLYPKDDENAAIRLNNLASCYAALGRSDEALKAFDDSLTINRRVFTGDHPIIAIALSNIGVYCENIGRPEKALPRHEESLAMMRRIHPGDHPDVALGLFQLGNCLRALKRPEEALINLDEALNMRRRIHAGDHREVFNVLVNIGHTAREAGLDEESERAIVEAIAMIRRTTKEETISLAAALRSLAMTHLKFTRLEKAKAAASEGAAIAARILPDGHALRKKFDELLIEIEKAQGDGKGSGLGTDGEGKPSG